MNDAYPYFRPGPDVVRFGRWLLQVDGQWQSLPERLSTWDTNTTLHLAREVCVDIDRLRQDCQLNQDASVALTTSWKTAGGGLTESISPIVVGNDEPFHLYVRLEGARLSENVAIRTTVTLSAIGSVHVPGAPQVPGSILTEDQVVVMLGPSVPAFPMHSVDFSYTRLDPDASWHLETTTDLDAPFLGSFLLLLNRRDSEMLDAATGARMDKRKESLLEELEHGVGSVLLELAIHHRSDLAERDWDPGTVGDVLQRVLDGTPNSESVSVATGPHDLAEARTALQGATRASGRGRRFS